MNPTLWKPSDDDVSNSGMTRFAETASRRWNVDFDNYESLHRWSVCEPEHFWLTLAQFCQVRASNLEQPVAVDRHKMPGAAWFPEAQLNFTDNLLRRTDAHLAIIFRGEGKSDVTMTYAQLGASVNRLARAFKDRGIRPGDRIAAYMPNIPETVICMLAAASCGAAWSSCSPDFGVRGVLDRFGQIEPKIVISVDGYTYGGKPFDITDKICAIADELDQVESFIIVPYLDGANRARLPANAISLDDYAGAYEDGPVEHIQLPFNHPLYILFSSGTTGVPKCIVHGAGGTLLQHLKEHRLHANVKPDDKLFFFTTCGWMMWNWLVTALASDATVVLYEGSPFHPDENAFFDYIDDYDINLFGISAKYIDAVAKAGLRPADTHRLSRLRTIMSTGSTLNPESFDYVYDSVKSDLCLSSMSGGTDLISCFVLGNPNLPVRRGEIQCAGLGMDVAVFDDDGRELPRGAKGELVCKGPFPSMPIGFWNDPDSTRYQSTYFEHFKGVWRHGDFVEITESGGMLVYGRSDAVLNPSGVRIGTAEIYRQAERVDEVVESLVIGQRWDGDTRVVLFVRLRHGITLNEELANTIRRTIRENASPRHVPAKIIQVADIPRTKSGKIVELAVRKIVHGESIDNLEALANPEALDHFRNIPQLASA